MKTAAQLRQNNIAEYLLYMWQIEDLLRANGCDIDRIRQSILTAFPEADRTSEEKWMDEMCNMMRLEGVVEKGHLQINKNVLLQLTELHNRLIDSTKYPSYSAAYYKVLPYIVELRHKGSENTDEPELETCFNALYGILLLRLQKKEISAGTQEAMKSISSFIALLADYYHKDKNNELNEE